MLFKKPLNMLPDDHLAIIVGNGLVSGCHGPVESVGRKTASLGNGGFFQLPSLRRRKFSQILVYAAFRLTHADRGGPTRRTLLDDIRDGDPSPG